MTAPTMTETCPSCGGSIALDFCEICGERRPSRRIYSLLEFAREAVEVFTNVERAFLKTLWTLIRRPGELVAAYMRGERVNYLKPLQFFLLVNVIFFFVAGWAGISMFSTPLYSHVNSSHYQEFAARRLAERLATTGLSEADYTAAFNQRGVVLARSMVFVMVPLFAAAVGLLTLRRRVSTQAVRHFVFSMHFICVLMFLTMVIWVIYRAARAVIAPITGTEIGWRTVDALMGVTAMTVLLAYLVPALRRSYDLSRVRSIVTALLLVVSFYWVLTAYRFILFLVITSQL